MYSLKNRAQLIGNLGNAPEIRTTEAGKKLVRFSVATSEMYRNAQGEKVKETQWHNLVAWGKVADIAEKYLKKGSEVAIEGKLITRNYADKEAIKNTLLKSRSMRSLCLTRRLNNVFRLHWFEL